MTAKLTSTASGDGLLNLRAGDIVEVRSKDEILATLGADGALDELPFMPEMLEYCGQRFEVFKRADKTCDTIVDSVSRRMRDAVHLKGLRCSGAQHGGCEASCLLFWKEAWLKRLGDAALESTPRMPRETRRLPAGCTDAQLAASVREPAPASADDVYRCQSTELNRATRPLPWWDPQQCTSRELRSGNVGMVEFLRVVALATFSVILRRTTGRQYPSVGGTLTRTPVATLGLQPGETVRVKSKQEIEATLDTNRRNRGLLFDREMVKSCGRELRVLKRVEKIIDEKTGKLITLPRDCIVLEGAVCCGDVSTKRLFCPRSIYPYWREIWLARVDNVE